MDLQQKLTLDHGSNPQKKTGAHGHEFLTQRKGGQVSRANSIQRRTGLVIEFGKASVGK